MYFPLLKDARPVRRYRIGTYLATLLTDCVSAGHTQYAHVLIVFKEGIPQPCFAVASEVNQMRGLGLKESDSHFLGVFPGDMHHNLGASKEWADLEVFARKALELTAGHLAVTQTPEVLPASFTAPPAKVASPTQGKKWWQFWK